MSYSEFYQHLTDKAKKHVYLMIHLFPITLFPALRVMKQGTWVEGGSRRLKSLNYATKSQFELKSILAVDTFIAVAYRA